MPIRWHENNIFMQTIAILQAFYYFGFEEPDNEL